MSGRRGPTADTAGAAAAAAPPEPAAVPPADGRGCSSSNVAAAAATAAFISRLFLDFFGQPRRLDRGGRGPCETNLPLEKSAARFSGAHLLSRGAKLPGGREAPVLRLQSGSRRTPSQLTPVAQAATTGCGGDDCGCDAHDDSADTTRGAGCCRRAAGPGRWHTYPRQAPDAAGVGYSARQGAERHPQQR